jgi:hypothetical protein
LKPVTSSSLWQTRFGTSILPARRISTLWA